MGMEVTGKFDFAGVLAQANAGRDRAAQVCTELILGDARDGAPVDEGTLRRSGRQHAFMSNRHHVSVLFGFDLPYAAKQHEELGYRHPHGGRPKFLEIAMARNMGKMKAILATQIRRSTS